MKCHVLPFAATYVWVAIIVNVRIKIMQRWMSESQFSVAKAKEDNDEKHKPSARYHNASQVFLWLSLSLYF